METADQAHGAVGIVLHQVGKNGGERAGGNLRHHLGQRGAGLGFFPVVDLGEGEDAEVFVPEFLHLVALRGLGLLLRGEEGGQLVAQAFVGELLDLLERGEVGAGEFLEAAGEQHAAGEQAFGGVGTAEFRGPFLQTVGDPVALVRGDGEAEELAELAEVVGGEFAGHGVGEAEDVIEAQVGFLLLGEVGEHLVENLAREVGRHLRQFVADFPPVARAEGIEETVGGGLLGGVGFSRAFEGGIDLGEVAGEFVVRDVLELFEELGVGGGGGGLLREGVR